MPAITLYRVRDVLVGDLPAVFDQVVEPDALGSCDKYDHSTADLDARLYVPAVVAVPPRWVSFIEPAFGDAAIGTSIAKRALVVAAVKRRNRSRVFAIPFGHARHMIRSELIQEAFGRRVALNLLYEPPLPGDAPAYQRIRQVDGRTIEANVRRARVQRSRDTSFETFGIDPERDLLDRIVGVPPNRDRYGHVISGGTSLHLDVALDFENLAGLLQNVLAVHERSTYRTHFSWVDKIRPVRDADLVSELRDRAAEMIRDGEDGLDLAPPEIVDWDHVSSFTFEVGNQPTEHADLKLSGYVAAVDGSRTTVSGSRLTTHKIAVRDGDGTLVTRWPVFKCVFGEVVHRNERFIVDEGRFYRVDVDYLAELDEYVAQLPSPTVVLPATTADVHEDVYNSAAAGFPDRLLLDRKNVWPAAGTTAIEVCDVLTAEGELVHVKRKLGSSDLSHLFGQGYVSAEAIHSGPEVRDRVRAKILSESAEQQKPGAQFEGWFKEPFNSGALSVVYAVLADWQGDAPEDRLPFFSKVNLRHHVRAISRMGYSVALTAVEAPEI